MEQKCNFLTDAAEYSFQQSPSSASTQGPLTKSTELSKSVHEGFNLYLLTSEIPTTQSLSPQLESFSLTSSISNSPHPTPELQSAGLSFEGQACKGSQVLPSRERWIHHYFHVVSLYSQALKPHLGPWSLWPGVLTWSTSQVNSLSPEA